MDYAVFVTKAPLKRNPFMSDDTNMYTNGAVS